MTALPAARLPGIGWMLACSLWLLPVLLGFGMTTWIGFAAIGIAVVRIRWVLVAGLCLYLLSRTEAGAEGIPLFLERVARGEVDLMRDGPLLGLYLAGVAYGLHANRVWLRILWGRRERGQRMLGWVRPPAATTAAAPADGAAGPGSGSRAEVPMTVHRRPAPAVADPRSARAELEARAARAFRTVLGREEARTAHALRELLERGGPAALTEDAPALAHPLEPASVPDPTPIVLTSLPAPPPIVLTSLPLPSTTALGLPRGPLDPRTASAEELAAIPAIGADRAALLVAARGVRPLDSVEDVVEVLGLAAHELVRVRPYLRF